MSGCEFIPVAAAVKTGFALAVWIDNRSPKEALKQCRIDLKDVSDILDKHATKLSDDISKDLSQRNSECAADLEKRAKRLQRHGAAWRRLNLRFASECSELREEVSRLKDDTETATGRARAEAISLRLKAKRKERKAKSQANAELCSVQDEGQACQRSAHAPSGRRALKNRQVRDDTPATNNLGEDEIVIRTTANLIAREGLVIGSVKQKADILIGREGLGSSRPARAYSGKPRTGQNARTRRSRGAASARPGRNSAGAGRGAGSACKAATTYSVTDSLASGLMADDEFEDPEDNADTANEIENGVVGSDVSVDDEAEDSDSEEIDDV